MSARFTFDTVVWRGDDELEIGVVYEVSPYIPAQGPTYACGGQPEEGGDVEIISVTHDGKPFDLTEDEEDALVTECINRSGEDMGEEAAAEADYRYEQYRDRQMMDRWERGE